MIHSAKRLAGALAGALLCVLILAACITPPPLAEPLTATIATPSNAQIVTVYVGPELADCVGFGPQHCLQVRAHPEDVYRLFCSRIVGFNYEPGYTYEIRMSVAPMPNPPGNVPAYSYTLFKVVSQAPYMAGAAPAAARPTETATPAPTVTAGQAQAVTTTVAPAAPASRAPAPLATVAPTQPAPAAAAANASAATALPVAGATTASAKALTPRAALPTATRAGGARVTVTAVKAAPPTPVRSAGAATRTALATRTAVARATLAARATLVAQKAASPTPIRGAGAATSVAPVTSAAVPTAPVALAGLPLAATPWQLISYTGPGGQELNTLPGATQTVEFRAGKLRGSAGCNNYFGTYRATGATLAVKIGGSTMMACSGPIMRREQTYLTSLARAATYQIVNGRLQITDAGGNTLLTYAARPPVALVGTAWQVNYYHNGRGAVVSTLVGSQITLTLGANGYLSGSAGCNRYDAAYNVQGAKLTIGPAAATRMLCAQPEGVMEQENDYLTALGRVASYEIQGNRLLLTDAQGLALVDAVVGPLHQDDRSQTELQSLRIPKGGAMMGRDKISRSLPA